MAAVSSSRPCFVGRCSGGRLVVLLPYCNPIQQHREPNGHTQPLQHYLEQYVALENVANALLLGVTLGVRLLLLLPLDAQCRRVHAALGAHCCATAPTAGCGGSWRRQVGNVTAVAVRVRVAIRVAASCSSCSRRCGSCVDRCSASTGTSPASGRALRELVRVPGGLARQALTCELGVVPARQQQKDPQRVWCWWGRAGSPYFLYM